jgi:MFS family permease
MVPVPSVVSTLLPIMAAGSAAFIVIGVALPVLPLHVHDDLGFGTFVVGLVAGSQFAACLFSRVWAGSFADRHGPKRGVMVGLLGAAAAGVLYLASLSLVTVGHLSTYRSCGRGKRLGHRSAASRPSSRFSWR